MVREVSGSRLDAKIKLYTQVQGRDGVLMAVQATIA